MNMKTTRILLPALATLLLTAAGCKTTEANYRAAYEKAAAKQREGLTEEELQGFEREKAVRKSLWRGDSIPLRAAYANTLAETKETTAALRYNIVIAEFTQRFNAVNAADRARAAGYTGARVLIDNTKRYYVSAVSTATLDSAVVLLRRTEADPPMPMRTPCPYILEKLGSR